MARPCTRREFLARLSAAHAAMVIGCRRTHGEDWLGRDRVCIHVFALREPLPPPLLELSESAPTRGEKAYFNAGLPELALCTTATKFLEMFQYFWPVSAEEIRRLQRTIQIGFQRPTVDSPRHIDDFIEYLRARDSRRSGSSTATLFTFNDYTRQWTPRVIRASEQAGVDEFVLFKDPTLPPYLCDYPARQKGFKRPPP